MSDYLPESKKPTPICMIWSKITPAQARSILEHTVSTGFPQRPVAPLAVRNYAKEMKSGTWHKDTADVIRLCYYEDEWAVLDGQHRLSGIVRSDKPLDTWIAYDVPEEAFKYVDQGMARQLSHVMSSAGWPSPNVLATCARFLICNDRGTQPFSISGQKWGSSGTQFDDAIALCPDLPNIWEAYGSRISKAAKYTGTTKPVIMLFFYLAEKIDHDNAVAVLNFLAAKSEVAPPADVYRWALEVMEDNARSFDKARREGKSVQTTHKYVIQWRVLQLAWLIDTAGIKRASSLSGFRKALTAWNKKDAESFGWGLS
jgi:hypothetical protein